ncbi:rod shape-determining protein MreC [Vicingaceae bacterium]|nr:rod shape-determining protein MreC [Vicingaceae bacterium]
MRNLITFIRKYSFFFLFVGMEALAFYLILKNNHFQGSSFLNSTNKVAGGIYTKYSDLTEYVNLKEVNDDLSNENRLLRENQLGSFDRVFGENMIVKDTIYKRKYLYTKAKVINNSTHRQNNYLTLSIGFNNGVQNGMGVIGPSGVVGVVKDVSANYSSVVSVLHRESKISVKLKKSAYFGSMQWDGEDYRLTGLKDIPNHVFLTEGDTVVTSGYSSIFPEGLPTALIKTFEAPEGENFYKIQMQLLNDFRQLTYVYVVNNNTSMEVKNLESGRENAND